MVFVNQPTVVKADLPFGGIRHSGYGRELLGLGIKEVFNHKLIDVVDINAGGRLAFGLSKFLCMVSSPRIW